MLLSVVAMVALVFGVSSCKKDDKTTPPVIVLDGYYVKGAATAYTDFNSKAMMQITNNENGGKIDSALHELDIPLKAGADRFQYRSGCRFCPNYLWRVRDADLKNLIKHIKADGNVVRGFKKKIEERETTDEEVSPWDLQDWGLTPQFTTFEKGLDEIFDMKTKAGRNGAQGRKRW